MTTRLEGSPASKFAQLIGKFGYNDYDRFEFATVVSPPPAIRIKIDNVDGITFEADDLVVAEHLTKHKREVTFTYDTVDGVVTRTGEMTFDDELDPGDRVLVASMNDGQAYVILDRVVQYGA